MLVRRLDPILVDRIAAGEVVERPAAAVKELVENAVDAGANSIEITVEAGGRRLIRIVDDGQGMTPEDLELAVERHATSKLPDGDLFSISTLGFRGEALPSIGAVARLCITTRTKDAETGSMIVVEGGVKHPVRPVSAPKGTRVEVTDLFAATPARLKFLKSDRSEAQAVAEIVKRLAIAHPTVRFTLSGEHITSFTHPPEEPGEHGFLRRISRVLGSDFNENAMAIGVEREGVRLTGFASLPTYHRGTSASVHFVVNGRPVRDKLLLGAVRGAYADVMASDRHPVLAMMIDLDPRAVDVNVHPAKTEVRFRDPAFVRGFVVAAIKEAITRFGMRASSTVGTRTLESLRPQGVLSSRPAYGHHRPSVIRPSGGFTNWQAPLDPASSVHSAASGLAEAQASLPDLAAPSADSRATLTEIEPEMEAAPLGAARAQLHGTYIVTQTQDGIVIVDQHAAHERLVYERLKRERASSGIARQLLLIPEVVDLDPVDADRVLAEASTLESLGLVVEPFGHGALLVREVPAALAGGRIKALVQDVADALAEWGQGAANPLEERLDAVLSRMSCHGSIRAGRRMRPEEMNALLREMEATPLSGQCNHGRPTYVELKLSDIERLFGRR
ncbi:DNA mismatch repair endonuclease MutL [Microvirga makkahensis]|uniref:DNA mismatch repair protein MutL n=1 Tax=Microvirga makkahensis TaxID=1128670 RepID=A0A7X3MWC2_9HYPH|nr:DNA mismatch repair endonuclease MutL [Microvirga makkahensis]MXQ14409.1 DNA mismatch repair endonuclease MutL [Microvirga makkahensis]